MCNKHKETFEQNTIFIKIKDDLLELIKTQVEEFETELSEKIENQDYEEIVNKNKKKKKDTDKLFQSSDAKEENDLTVLNISLTNWDVLYQCLLIFEKLSKNFSNLITQKITNDNILQYSLIKCLKHPHSFIKNAILRIIGIMFSMIKNFNNFYSKLSKSKFNINNENVFGFMLLNFRFIILNSDLPDKAIEQTTDNCVFLLEQFSKLDQSELVVKEFITNVYLESKSYISNKDLSSVIFNRIFDLFDKVLLNLNASQIENTLEPMLSLIYRIESNVNTSDELKHRANSVLDNLKKSIEQETLSKKYKEVSMSINLLKRKRKTDLMANVLTDQKEYIKKKSKK